MSLYCPRCGSTSVTLETGGYGGMIYRCKTCGFSGAFVIESDDESKIASWAALTQVHDAPIEEWTTRKSLLIKVLAAMLLFLLLISLITILAITFGCSL